MLSTAGPGSVLASSVRNQAQLPAAKSERHHSWLDQCTSMALCTVSVLLCHLHEAWTALIRPIHPHLYQEWPMEVLMSLQSVTSNVRVIQLSKPLTGNIKPALMTTSSYIPEPKMQNLALKGTANMQSTRLIIFRPSTMALGV